MDAVGGGVNDVIGRGGDLGEDTGYWILEQGGGRGGQKADCAVGRSLHQREVIT